VKILLTNKFHNTTMWTRVEPHLEGAAERGEYLDELAYYFNNPGCDETKKERRIFRNLCPHKLRSCDCSSMVTYGIMEEVK